MQQVVSLGRVTYALTRFATYSPASSRAMPCESSTLARALALSLALTLTTDPDPNPNPNPNPNQGDAVREFFILLKGECVVQRERFGATSVRGPREVTRLQTLVPTVAAAITYGCRSPASGRATFR